MQTFFFDMKDGVPLRDRIGIEFNTNLEAIEHSHALAQHFRDDSLTDDQDLEIIRRQCAGPGNPSGVRAPGAGRSKNTETERGPVRLTG